MGIGWSYEEREALPEEARQFFEPKLRHQINMAAGSDSLKALDSVLKSLAKALTPMSCGHPPGCVVSADEGTGYCGWCEAEQKLAAATKRIDDLCQHWMD